jgi:hypothetical protein
MEYQGRIFYKVVREDLTHNAMVYKQGLNIDPLEFNPVGSCQSGGLYFTDFAHLGRFYAYGALVAIITIPEDAQVYRDPEEDKWKADRFIIERFESIESYWSYQAFCMDAIKGCGRALQYVKKQTRELCLEAVKRIGLTLQYVDIRFNDHEICMEAVKEEGYALRYVDNKTPDICLEAVKQNGCALRYVENQTHRICLAAVKQNVNALQYVKKQTQELCLEAVKHDAEALEYVEKQYCVLCLEAIKQKQSDLITAVNY